MSRRGNVAGIAFRDVLLLLNIVLGALVLMVLPSINPPAAKEAASAPPGQMIISAAWPDGNIDVDLWAQAPGEKKAVGYSNRGGSVMNLLRDDLGHANDGLPMNFENIYSRGLPAGEYVVNVHLYRGKGPVPVAIEIRFGPPGSQPDLFLQETVVLGREGQEITVVRFRLDAAGRVVAGSVSKVFKPLRAAKEG